MLAVLALCLLGLAAAPKGVHAEWRTGAAETAGGCENNCPTAASVCQDWVDHSSVYIEWRNMDPQYNAAGQLTHFECELRHFLQQGTWYTQPMLTTCSSGSGFSPA